VIVLRPDQAELKAGIYRHWNEGDRNVLAVLPTGGGKSVIVSDIVLDRHHMGATQCVIAHRTELVGQMSLHVARRGIKHRIIAPKAVVGQIMAEHRREFAGRSFINPDANCSVAGVDTLLARADDLRPWCEQVDDWTIDEAHHVLKQNKWGRAAALFPRARGLGVTATPSRADGMGLGAHHDGVFNAMVVGPDMRTLIDIGALTDYEIAIPESDFEISENDLAPSGDWSSKKMREASKRSHIVGDVVQQYVFRAYGKRFICFATDVETAGEIAQRFNDCGIMVAAVSAVTPGNVRDEYIRRFRAGQLWGLVNVDLFGEGFDVPAVEVVIMARPTASLAVYMQQFGRALRVLAGKAYGLVIDHVSNWKRHGFPDKPHYWTLDRRDKRAKREKDPEDIPLTAISSGLPILWR
jgi:DNA repair protein RadD